MTKLLCIFHGPSCDDGFAAAWVVQHTLGEENVEFHAASYGEAPPDVADRKVLIVDFSFPISDLEEMAQVADGILILDHHKTAAEDLAGLPEPPSFSEWINSTPETGWLPWRRLAAVFDMKRSGAGLTWDFLKGTKRPLLIDYIEDRDLWTKQLPGIDEFTMALRSYPRTFEAWDRLPLIEDVITEGRAIFRYYRSQLEDQKTFAYRAWLGGLPCAVVNGPMSMASDLANEIIDQFDDAQFGVVWCQLASGEIKYSLRSRDHLLDVSEIAKKFGGGGHRNAAGFTWPHTVHE